MENLDNKIDALKKYLDSVSDAEFDKLLDEIDQIAIEGPAVKEYFSGIEQNQIKRMHGSY